MSREHRRRLVSEIDSLLSIVDPILQRSEPYRGLIHAYRGLAGSKRIPHEYSFESPIESANDDILIFLHGHGGNLAVYPLAWESFAAKFGISIIMPSFSYGNWQAPEAQKVIEKIVENLKAVSTASNRRIFLAGISQGGAGVSRIAAAMPDCFAGLIYFSPTMENKVIQSPQFNRGCAGVPILVFQGGRDRQVSAGTVHTAVEFMRGSGLNVTYVFEEAEDHFFFFGQRERIQEEVANWMKLQGK